ncbi:MAG TPA: PAS domain S-box protein [Bacteroidota bacterium]|nr:PAS domain S-box protein [Bacteroidota bacterium]
MKKGIAVLLVEDSESDATLLLNELTQAGYDVESMRVDTAANFSAALDTRPWDVILCDFRMPSFDGLKALQLFKERRLDTPFIFVSGAISEEIAIEAMRAGAHDYVMKTNLRRLVPAVEREIHEASERREKNILREERARIEGEMRRRDVLFRSLIQFSSDGILLIDKDGAILYHSPSAARILSYSSDTLPGKSFFDLIHSDDLSSAKEYFQHLRSSPGNVSHHEVRLSCADGSVRWMGMVGHNLFEDGNVGAIVLNYRDITERKTAEEEMRRSQQQLRALAANLQVAREEERKSISREFHDLVAQSLTALKMGLSLLHREIAAQGRDLPLETIDAEIQSMRREIDHTTQTVRTTLSKLRPELLDQLGILAAMSWDIERFQKRSGIPCKLTSNAEEIPLDPKVSIALFRIYQEALTNIVRHAEATAVEVTVRADSDSLTMAIKDNGVGITSGSENESDSFGLIGMRERALLLHGTFHIEGAPSCGTTVTVTVPLKTPAA